MQTMCQHTEMSKEELSITRASEGLLVFCNMSATTKDWPSTITHEWTTYRFAGQWFLSPQHAGVFAGCAKYVKGK